MKRKKCNTNGEHSLKKAKTSVYSDSLRSQITEKLQAILNGLYAEIDTYSVDKPPDLSLLIEPQDQVPHSSKSFVITRSRKACEANHLLANFIDKVKCKLSELLLKESEHLEDRFKVSKNKTKNDTETRSRLNAAVSLQIQIARKLQSLLSASAGRETCSNNNCRLTGCNVLADGEWKHLSVMLQDFINSTKKKLPTLSSRPKAKKSVDHNQNSNSRSSSKENYLQSKELRAFRQSFHKVEALDSAHPYIPLSTSYTCHNMMTSPIHSESDSFDSPYLGTSRSHSNVHYNSGGVLLLEEAERAPEYLRLTIDSDVDEPDQGAESNSDSEEDVVVLGEKRPTYQEITLEEDERGEVKESVVEKEKSPDKEEEDHLFECPSCDKSYRLESLLKFHVKMHNSFNFKTSDSSSLQSNSKDEEDHQLVKHKKKRHSSEKREDSKLKKDSKTSHKHKTHKEKHKSHKRHKHKRSAYSD